MHYNVRKKSNTIGHLIGNNGVVAMKHDEICEVART